MTPTSRISRLFILVVDADDGAAQRLALQVRTHGHEVFIAHSAEQAERILLVHPSDVILIDTHPTGEDGCTTAKHLCGTLKKRPFLVGMMGRNLGTEHPRPDGFDAHVQKPVDACELNDLLRKHADRGIGAPKAAVSA